MMRGLLLLSLFIIGQKTMYSQACDCPYPIIFLHGFTGNQDSYSGTYLDADFISIWGSQSDIFHAVMNAQSSTNIWGADGIPGNADDDVLYSFNNESNFLSPGCVYSLNLENWWNEDEANPLISQNVCSAPSLFSSNSNESSIYKSGYVLGKMIEKVMIANPSKDKVILVGHSMGGLNIREYLQRDGGTWWASNTPGHGVKKAVTTVTPHLGSNLFGNPWPVKPDEVNATENGLPDINSEAARDLRWSYSFNPIDPNNCGFLGSCPGPYLFGGDESMPWGYWNEDINCDGDDDQDDVIIGINNSGGTFDNSTMPLPTDIRYTWVTSDVGTGGDLVVDIDRQWIYSGNNPKPFDGVSYRQTDTLLTDVGHLNVDDEVNTVVRALDESDYPKWAWDIELDNIVPYTGVAQFRSASAPDGPNTRDPDWFRVFIPSGTTKNLCIQITPIGTQSASLDYFSSPADYTTMATSGDANLVLPIGTGATSLIVLNADLNIGANNYIRVIHDGVGVNTWRTAYKINTVLKTALPIELLSFEGEIQDDRVLLEWETTNEINNQGFEILKSENGIDFRPISFVEGAVNSNQSVQYSIYDEAPTLGTNYYKLKQIDLDGNFTLSHAIALNFENEQLNDFKLFPNPASNRLYLEVSNPNFLNAKISINDLNGKVFQSTVLSDHSIKEIDIHQLPKGIYIIQLNNEGNSIKKLFVKT